MVLIENPNSLVNNVICDTENGVYIENDNEVSNTMQWVLVSHYTISQLTTTPHIILQFISSPQPTTPTELKYEMYISATINIANPTRYTLLDATKLTRIKLYNNRHVSYNCYEHINNAHKYEISGYPSFRSKMLTCGDNFPTYMHPIFQALKDYLIYIENDS